MAEGETGRWLPPSGPPSDWPTAAPPGPSTPAPAPARRRRWPWLLGGGALVLAGAAGAGAAVVLSGDDGDVAYCAALDTRSRVDVQAIMFLHEDASDDDAARLRRQLEAEAGVSAIDYVDQDEAFAEAQEMFAGEPSVAGILQREDVPPSLRFTASDGMALIDVRRAFQDEAMVLSIEDPIYLGRTVLEVVDLVAGEHSEGEDLGRFGAWISPSVAERLRDTAPGEVADDIDRLLEPLAAEEGVVEARHLAAMEDVVADAEERCAEA